MSLKKVFLSIFCLVSLILVFYSFYIDNYASKYLSVQNKTLSKNNIFSNLTLTTQSTHVLNENLINVWCIFSKVTKNPPLKGKFRVFVQSLLKYSTKLISLNILSDNSSKLVAKNLLQYLMKQENKTIKYQFYDIHKAAEKINDIVQTMTPHFSSQPGTYYSDALFYISLGLHRIAPKTQKLAIMVDCDIKFVSDVQELYEQFKTFDSTTLFGLAPELTPVYRHVLYNYRLRNKNSTFGDYIIRIERNASEAIVKGFPGYNSGVVLFNLDRIRRISSRYEKLISRENVDRLTEKYYFKGHLGDQDFYTILGFEYSELIKMLPCTFNRQLCTWWKDHGYADVFDYYFQCDGDVKIYHGNCNTPIPETVYMDNK